MVRRRPCGRVRRQRRASRVPRVAAACRGPGDSHDDQPRRRPLEAPRARRAQRRRLEVRRRRARPGRHRDVGSRRRGGSRGGSAAAPAHRSHRTRAGVPLLLTLQYTPPACASDARLELGVNDELLQVITLRNAPEPITEVRELFVPSYRLRSRSQLQFGFRFPLKTDGACRDARPEIVKAVVSPDSSIDFSGFPHHAQMPTLNHFATIGFPFTRYADLSQTVVVLPDKPVAADIEAMLGLMGRMGESTGYPATRV